MTSALSIGEDRSGKVKESTGTWEAETNSVLLSAFHQAAYIHSHHRFIYIYE